MTDIAVLGLRIKSEEALKAANDLGVLTVAAEKTEKATDRLAPASKKAGDGIKKVGDESRSTEGALHSLASRVGTVAGALVAMATAALSVGAYVKLADSWSDLRSQLGAAIGDMGSASGMMQRMVDIANASYSPLDQTVQVYARNVSVLRDLGKTADQAADFTESLNHMLVITATKGERAASVQNALSKAMAVGKLQADGLETVLANSTSVSEALANELGTTVSGLRDMASQGKITGQVIADAIIKPLEDVRSVAGEMDTTVSDGFMKIGNAMQALVGNFDQATGASKWFATQLDDLSKWITLLSQTDFAGWMEAAAGAATVLGQAILILAATRIPVAIAALVTFNYTSAATTAAMAIQATGARALGAAMALAGGPIGLLVAGAAALGVALYNTRSQIDAVRDSLNTMHDAQIDLDAAMETFYRERTQQALTSWQTMAEAQVGMVQASLEAAKQELANAEFYTNFFGISLWETDRMAEASAAIAQLEAGLDRAKASQEAAAVAAKDFAANTVVAANGVVMLTAEQEKAVLQAQAMEQSYRDRAALAQTEAQYGRDSAQYMAEQLSQERAIQHAKINSLDISNQQKTALRAQYDEMMRIEARTQGWKVELGKLPPPLQSAYDWLVKIRDAQPGEGWLSTAIGKAAALATELWDAVRAKGALSATAVDDAENPVVPGLSRGIRPQQPGVDSYGDWLGAGSSGGGGGGASDQFGGNLQSLIESLETEQATVDAWYESSKTILFDRRAEEILGIEAHNAAKVALEEEYQRRLREITDAERHTRFTEMSDMFSGLASIAAAGGNKMLKTQAVLSSAATMIAGYEAAMKAAAEAKTIPGRIAAYVKFVGMAAGAAAQISKIGGAGGGSAGGGGATAAPAAAAAPETPLRVSADAFDTNQLYTGEAVQKWFDAIQKEAGNRGIQWVPV
ncbi:tape measure protein [Pseudogemmobacter faecipullorum]|uniref:Tape measure protein n=1 Tax=Pseudogemmobacter faecipullorum TaxID=2755041 RepID=A0ABS8CQW9_9RHOB|nr:tape measure protein [Pseudogemmobacter faecipullorum]MCB5411777.1 tape measure protein [Pseudogemmobacter faecipullorum]